MCYLEPLLLTSAPEEILSSERNLVATGATESEWQPSEVDGEAGGGSALRSWELITGNGTVLPPTAITPRLAARRADGTTMLGCAEIL